MQFVSFNPDGTRLASFSEDKTVLRWDVATGELLATTTGRDRAALSAHDER